MDKLTNLAHKQCLRVLKRPFIYSTQVINNTYPTNTPRANLHTSFPSQNNLVRSYTHQRRSLYHYYYHNHVEINSNIYNYQRESFENQLRHYSKKQRRGGQGARLGKQMQDKTRERKTMDSSAAMVQEFQKNLKNLPFLGSIVHHYVPGYTKASKSLKFSQGVSKYMALMKFKLKFGMFKNLTKKFKEEIIPEVIEDSVYTLPQYAPGSAYAVLSSKLLTQKYQLHRFKELPKDFIQDAKIVQAQIHRLDEINQEYIQVTFVVTCKYPDDSTSEKTPFGTSKKGKRMRQRLKETRAKQLSKETGIKLDASAILTPDEASTKLTSLEEGQLATEYITLEHSLTRDDAEWLFAGVVNHTKQPFYKIHPSTVAVTPQSEDKEFVDRQISYYSSKRKFHKV